jgi:hypothetical protein
MVGVKGAGGPPPKRSDQRRRRNVPAAGEPERVVDDSVVVIPDPDPGWHRAARIVWDSLSCSGQNKFFASSDWAAAYTLCESMSREFAPQPMVVGSGSDARVELVEVPPKGASLSAWRALMAGLLMTEGDRRRVALELQRPATPEETKAVVTDMRSWKQGLG